MATILIIDDDIALLARLATRLTEAGYEVIKRSEAILAEVVFVEQRPDLVLLEVKTSQDAGWDLLERFAGQVPVIVLSADGREEDVVRGLEAGAIDYITKPYRSVELLTRIRLRLNGAGQARHQPAPLPQAPPQQPAPASLSRPADDATAEEAADSAPRLENRPAGAPPMAGPPGTAPASLGGESVFMTESEELNLLRSEHTAPAPQAEMLPDHASLGERLRMERQRRRITLVQAENETKVRMWYLQAIEEEKFTLLPQGPIATNMLHSYATYLGIDSGWALEQYHQLHTSHPAPTPQALGSDQQRTFPRWLIWTIAIVLALLVSGAGITAIDPAGVNALSGSLRSIVAPLPTLTPTATTRPTSTTTARPTSTTTPTITPTATPPPSPTVDAGNR